MFKWIHLSDLHFQSKENYGIERAREVLPDYLQRKVEKCNAVFLTGDFRYAKNSIGDIEEIASFITKIKESVEAQYVICVPGNHDLERSNVRTAIIDGVLKDYNPEENSSFDEGMLNLLKGSFSFYDGLMEKLNLTYRDAQKENVHEVVETEECNLLLLNTAITAGRDNERGSLVMGINSVKHAFRKVNHEKPLIVIGHHGASFWNREEQKILFDLFEREKVKLYLCGHEHILYNEHIGNNPIMQITAGCMESAASDNPVEIGFCVGNLDSEGKVQFGFHSWNNSSKAWAELDKRVDDIYLIQPKKRYNKNNSKDLKEDILKLDYPSSEKQEYQFTLNGHTLLGSRGMYGIRYYWKKGEEGIESLAFNQRLCEPIGDAIKDQENQQISAYTVSVSFGCVLSTHLSQCRFCETGSRNFKGFLSAEEIAMQNIFMATYDSACPSYPEVRTHKREFSFMGQGEPGYNYPAVREAIRITDIAMKELNQEVYRYNISTCGISDFIPMLISDIKAGMFRNPVTLHYSLHAIGDDRNRLMPINVDHNYSRFIKNCEKLYEVNDRKKIGIGLLMFKNFKPVKRGGESEFVPYTLTKDKLNAILNILNPEMFSIDLCDLNKTSLIDEQEEVSNEEALDLLKIAKDRGFEAKIFSSFASEQKAGCGMLSSEYLDAAKDGEKTQEQYNKSLELLNYSVYKLKMED